MYCTLKPTLIICFPPSVSNPCSLPAIHARPPTSLISAKRKRIAILRCCQAPVRQAEPPLQVVVPRQVPSRRHLLQSIAPCLAGMMVDLPAKARTVPYSEKALVPPEVQQYWDNCVASLKGQLGDRFDARLVVFGSKDALPIGAPGDPAKDFQSSRSNGDGTCGPYIPIDRAAHPYATCPPVGQPGADPTITRCCRHLAYCVSRNRLSLTAEERVSNVVVSSRMFDLSQASIQAIIVHELGHCVDFWLYGGRYGRNNQSAPALSATMKDKLKAINAEEDVEARADLLGELFLLDTLQTKLCYNRELTMQTLVSSSTPCGGPVGTEEYMRHFPHPLLVGQPRKRIS